MAGDELWLNSLLSGFGILGLRSRQAGSLRYLCGGASCPACASRPCKGMWWDVALELQSKLPIHESAVAWCRPLPSNKRAVHFAQGTHAPNHEPICACRVSDKGLRGGIHIHVAWQE